MGTMSLRLFHVTEFAHSMLSPAEQRESRHSAFLILIGALWLALVSNLPLWRSLYHLPVGLGGLLWLVLCFALINTAALGLLLSALNWSRILRPVLTLLLWLCALNTLLLWTGHAPLRWATEVANWKTMLAPIGRIDWWKSTLALVLLALIPSIWLWRAELRRMTLPVRLSHNLLLGLFHAGLLIAFWSLGRQTLLPLLQEHPRWLELLSPFNSLLTLR